MTSQDSACGIFLNQIQLSSDHFSYAQVHCTEVTLKFPHFPLSSQVFVKLLNMIMILSYDHSPRALSLPGQHGIPNHGSMTQTNFGTKPFNLNYI